MTINAKSLQGVVDQICGDCVVAISQRTEVIVELDDHGRNLAATWIPCSACAGWGVLHTTPIVQPDVKLKAWCPTCDGVGHVIESEPTRQISVLSVKLGRVEMSADAPASQVEAEGLVKNWASSLRDGKI